MNKFLFIILLLGLPLINTLISAQQDNECNWELLITVICQPDTVACGTAVYDILMVFPGIQSDSLLIINNLTEDTSILNIDNPNAGYLLKDFRIQTGYDFTILDPSDPSCLANESATSIDCIGGSVPFDLDAKEDEAVTEINTSLIVDVLGNDRDAICVSDVTPFSQAGGTVAINDDCTLTYTPPTDFLGVDYFLYTNIIEIPYIDFESNSSAEVKVLVIEEGLDSFYVQEEIICSGQEQLDFDEKYLANFYFPFYNGNYYWRFCGDTDWQFVGDTISGPDTPLVFEFTNYPNKGYCLEFVDLNHPNDIVVKEKMDVNCLYIECCFIHFDVNFEKNCDPDTDSVQMTFTLENVAASQKYQWRHCWTETWNDILVEEGQNLSEPFIIEEESNSDICLEFRYAFCKDHYFAFWEENINCPTTSSIESDIKPTRLNIFPNPTSQFLQIDFPNFNKAKIDWQILDVQGRTVMEGFAETESNQLHLGVESLSAGTYFLKVSEALSNEHFIERFVVVK